MTVWQQFTDLDAKKQGPALYLSLNGKARECARSIATDVLGSDDGFKKLLDILDKLFLKDADTRAFLAFKEFYEYKRPYDCSVTDFIAHYEYLYGKVVTHNMTLPEGVKAFFLLKAANVTDEQEKLARATCDKLTYDLMKSNITKIFGDFSLSNSSVKTEPEFYARSADSNEVYYSRNNNGRGKGNFSHKRYDKSQSSSSSRNNYKCYECGSPDHLKRAFPRLKIGEEVHKVHITLMEANENHKVLDLVKESFGMALLDCGCTITVVGKL